MTAIEWTDETWNPVTGCSKVSPGCDHCYAETLSLRFGRSKLPWTPENAEANVVLHPERLRKPASWRTPRRVFVNSMSDMFHENIPDDYIARVFEAMGQARRHTFQVLTKRPRRAAEWFARVGRCEHGWLTHDGTNPARAYDGTGEVLPEPWPLPNVWLGVSIESWRFNWRADVLREIPAAVRFISAEPLLDTLYPYDHPERALNLDGIHWLIVGGESGHGFRPMQPEWAQEIRDACLLRQATQAALRDRTAFFFKQWGGRTPKAGGRELDGRTWDEYPA